MSSRPTAVPGAPTMAVNVALDPVRRLNATFAAHVAGDVTVGRAGLASATFAAADASSGRDRTPFHRQSFGIVTGCVQDAPGPRKGPQAQL
jgi:hypothetical protein